MSDTLIPSDAVEAIQAGVKTETIRTDNREFLTREVFLPPAEPLPKAIEVHTLSGFIEFVEHFAERNKLDLIQVCDHSIVQALGNISGLHQRRAVYAQATLLGQNKFRFNQYLTPEDFIIGVQTGFASSDMKDRLLALVGNLKDEKVRNIADDGITQMVTVKAGISLVAEQPVPNPVALAPYRTFPEIIQPSSLFVLRVQGGKEGQLPTIGLFETCDGQWQLRAIKDIQNYFDEHLDKDIPVIA